MPFLGVSIDFFLELHIVTLTNGKCSGGFCVQGNLTVGLGAEFSCFQVLVFNGTNI